MKHKKHQIKKRKGFFVIIAIAVVVIIIVAVFYIGAALAGDRQGASKNGEMTEEENTSGDPQADTPLVVPNGPCGQKIIQIASNEVNAIEVSKGSNQGPRNSPSGHGISEDYKHGGGYGQPWCSYFATWVLKNAGDKIPVKPLASDVYQYYNSKGQAFTKESVLSGTNTPQPGDIFVRNLTGSGHIGIVESYSNGIIKTIEGNSSDRVRRGTININSNNAKGFGRPQCQ